MSERLRQTILKRESNFLTGMNGMIPRNLDEIKERCQEHGYDNLFRFIRDKTRQGYSARAIGEMIGVTHNLMLQWQDRAAIKRQPRGGSPAKWNK